MLKNLAGLLVILVLTIPAISQDYTPGKTKKLLTANEWELKYILKGDKKQDPPEELKGLRLVFMPSKELVYEYQPGQTDPIYIRKGRIDAEQFKYEDRIEEPEMTMDMDQLEQGVLSFSDEYDKEYQQYVYVKGQPIKDKGYPAGKYEVQDLDVPMQRINPEATSLVSSINTELKKASGNLFFYDKNKDRYLIKEASFTATEYGVKFAMVYDSKSYKNRTYSYEFLPERIDEMSEVKVDPDSRVGQLKITLDNESCFYTSSDGPGSIIKTVYIDFLKESVNSFNNIKEKFDQLSTSYLFGRIHRLDFLKQYIDKGRKIWLSQDGTSSNFQFSSVDLIGNKIYLQYNLETVDLSSTKKGSYMTVIPLRDITALTVELTKSNPKTLIMHNKKKGFDTYVYKDGKYVSGSRMYSMPLFNYGEISWKQQRIEKTLRQLIDDDGGDKIKLVYNP